MKTYQDLLALGDNDRARREFIREVVKEHKCSDLYKTADIAEAYDRQENPTVVQYKRMITNMLGQQVEDLWHANYRLASNHFNRFMTQENQYLLGNGLVIDDKIKREKLGKDFDMRLVDMGRNALVDGVSFGFFDKDRLRVFSVLEFAPLYDEENGALRAGVRFWQIETSRPIRYTLFEEDGYTEYIYDPDRSEEIIELQPKRKYIQIVQTSEADGIEIVDGENYPSFPVIPMWGNEHHRSELCGRRETIDCYNLIESGFANNVDDASEIFWIIKNGGGMSDVDLAQFIERMKTIKAASVDSEEGGGAEAHTLNVPYEAREKLLERLESDLYKDFMAFNVEKIVGSATATEINAAYQPFDNKVDKFEYCVFDFLVRLFELVGIKEEAKPFKRSKITNQLETTQMVLMAAQYLDNEAILNKLPWLTSEEITEILKRKDAESIERFSAPVVKKEEVIE